MVTHPGCHAYLLEEDLCLHEDLEQLDEVEKVLLQRLLIIIDLLHLRLQDLKLGLGGGAGEGCKSAYHTSSVWCDFYALLPTST